MTFVRSSAARILVSLLLSNSAIAYAQDAIIADARNQAFLSLQLRGTHDTAAGLRASIRVYDQTFDSAAFGEITISRVSDGTVLFARRYDDPLLGNFNNPGSLDDPLPVPLPYGEDLEVTISGGEFSAFRAIIGSETVASGGTTGGNPPVVFTTTLNLIQDPPVFFDGTGNHYKIVFGSLAWEAARTAATQLSFEGIPGHLATITSQEENDFVASLLDTTLPNTFTANAWLGANDIPEPDVWKWIVGPEAGQVFWRGKDDGSSPTFAGWGTGINTEPNDGLFAAIRRSGQFGFALGEWDDLDNDFIAAYVVEFEALGRFIPGDLDDNGVFDIADSTVQRRTLADLPPGISQRCGQGVLSLTDFAGGLGGSPTTLSCPVGSVAIGLEGRAGDDIDRTVVPCREIVSVGLVALPLLGRLTRTNPAGGLGGTDYAGTLTCPAGSVMTGLFGTEGNVGFGFVVDQLGVECTGLGGGGIARLGPVGIQGAPGGTEFAVRCQSGSAAVGVRLRRGAVLDQIRLECR